LPFSGTLGVLLDAKRARLISSIAPYVDELRRRNFHLSLRACEAILLEAGEISRE
jgi:predicted nucleic acid-binding protein